MIHLHQQTNKQRDRQAKTDISTDIIRTNQQNDTTPKNLLETIKTEMIKTDKKKQTNIKQTNKLTLDMF